jgi:hypothetical protein
VVLGSACRAAICHVAQWDASVECSHDERGAKHVRMYLAETGPFGDRTHPAMRGAPLKALPVTATQDRPIASFADSEVDRPRGARDERNDRRLVALADDLKRAMATLEPQVLNVGRACLADAQAVQAQ